MQQDGYRYKRLKRWEIERQGRYLTFSCYDRLPLFGNDAIKQAFTDRLEHARQLLGFRLLAWVIMPEHVHLMIIPQLPAAPVPVILRNIKGAFAQRVIARWKDLDAPILSRIAGPDGSYSFWQAGGGYDRNTFSSGELVEKVRYIHQNPVRRGLVAKETDWPWSSARWYAGDESGTPVITRMC